MTIIWQFPWTEQPPNAVDLSDGYQKAIVWCPGINQRGDIFGANPGTNVSSAADSVFSGGKSVYISGVGGRWETAAGAGLSLGTSENKSFLVYLDLIAFATSFDYVMSVGNGWAIAVRHGSIGARVGVYDGATIRDTGVSVSPRRLAILVCHNASAQTIKTYINGVQASTVASVVGTAVTTGQKLVIGNTGLTNVNAPQAHYYLGAVIGNDLSARGVELTTNPWQLFAPRTQRIWEPVLGGAYTLNAETGVYTFVGSNATLLHNYQLTLDSASYSLTGSNATLLKGLILDAQEGSYTLTGNDATFVYNRLLNASSGSYSLTGADANLIYTPTSGAYVLNAGSGAYVLTGSNVTFAYSGGLVTLKAGSWIRYRIIT